VAEITAKTQTTAQAMTTRQAEIARGGAPHTIAWHISHPPAEPVSEPAPTAEGEPVILSLAETVAAGKFKTAIPTEAQVEAVKAEAVSGEPVVLGLAESIAASKFGVDVPTEAQVEAVKAEAVQKGLSPETGKPPTIKPALDPALQAFAKSFKTPLEARDALLLRGYAPSTVSSIIINASPELAGTAWIPTPSATVVVKTPEGKDIKTSTARLQAIGKLPDEEQFAQYLALGTIPKGSQFVEGTQKGEWGYLTLEQVKARTEFEAQLEQAPPELQEAYKAGGVKGYNAALEKYNAEKSARMAAIQASAEQAREQEMAKAQAETLPEPEQTYTYRDPKIGMRTVTEDERKAILDEKGWSSSYFDRFTRDMPAIEDTVREVLTLGGWLGGELDTYTYNRPELEKQYEQQKEIALATFMGDTNKLQELYEAGAFGKDETIPNFYYQDPDSGTRLVSLSERRAVLDEKGWSSSYFDKFVRGRGVKTTPQAYKDALTIVQQQADIDKAVKAGDVPQLERLYQEGAFGSDLAAYANLAKYIEEGGRELSPVTDQDVKAVSEGFGTKKEYVDAVLTEQPTTASMAKDIAIAMVPVYGTIYFWDKMGTGMKAVSIATDALSLIPIVGGISAAAKVAAGVGRGARIASAMKVVPRLVTRELFAPLETALHPLQTAKALGSTVKGLVNVLNPRHIPGSTLSTVYSTVRLDTAILGDPVATMYVRDQLMALQAAGKKPVVQFGGKEFTLRSGTFLDEGGVVHASPNIRFAGEPEGFTIPTKTYPEGHPKAGQRMPDSEQGMFVANVALERFAVGGSAFGFEKGAASAVENIKVITEAAEQAKSLGDIKKAAKLSKLVDDYNSAITSKSIKALDKAESKIVSKLAEIAEDEVIAKINLARKTAGERYAIGDVKGTQEAMLEALSYEKQLQKARPGFAIFSPDIAEILIPSGKAYTGMIFRPKAGEFWSIAMTEMKQDRAAQLLKQAQDATRLGDKATAAKLTKEARDLIGKGKSGFRKVETAEMELKFPELAQMQQLKPRYATTASDTGAKLWIYITEPYSLKKALKAKLMAPIDTLRNIYEPAIKVRTIPMTKAQKLAKVEKLIEQAKSADKVGDVATARILRTEADILERSLKGVVKGVTGADNLATAITRAERVDDATELIQASKRAEAVGDYASADRLRRAADAIAGRRYVSTIARRAGTVSCLAEYARALGAMRLDERRLGEPIRDIARVPGRIDARRDRLPSRTDARVSELRSPRDTGARRTPDADRVPRKPVERDTDTRLPRRMVTRITRTPDGRKIPDTGRVPETPRVPRTPKIHRAPETPRRFPKITDMTITKLWSQGVSVENGKARLPGNSVTWRQGMFWKWIPREDFKDGVKPRTLPRGLTPIGAKFTDLKTPQETVQVIGATGIPVPDFRVDLGKTDISITDQAQTIRYTGKGERTNVGSRIPNTTQGMTVDGGAEAKGHAYAKPVKERNSVSRTADSQEEPVRGRTSVRGISRPKIADDTKAMLEGTYEEPELEPAKISSKLKLQGLEDEEYPELLATGYGKGTYFDEDPEWLGRLEPSIMETRKKTTNRTKASRQKPKRGKSNNIIIVGGVRL